VCADIRDGREQLLPSKGRIQMSKTNYLQAVISDLQRTAGPYSYAKRGSSPAVPTILLVTHRPTGGTSKAGGLNKAGTEAFLPRSKIEWLSNPASAS